jgi:hypothetical protein
VTRSPRLPALMWRVDSLSSSQCAANDAAAENPGSAEIGDSAPSHGLSGAMARIPHSGAAGKLGTLRGIASVCQNQPHAESVHRKMTPEVSPGRPQKTGSGETVSARAPAATNGRPGRPDSSVQTNFA